MLTGTAAMLSGYTVKILLSSVIKSLPTHLSIAVAIDN